MLTTWYDIDYKVVAVCYSHISFLQMACGRFGVAAHNTFPLPLELDALGFSSSSRRCVGAGEWWRWLWGCSRYVFVVL